jgi:hypothetical protein
MGPILTVVPCEKQHTVIQYNHVLCEKIYATTKNHLEIPDYELQNIIIQ